MRRLGKCVFLALAGLILVYILWSGLRGPYTENLNLSCEINLKQVYCFLRYRVNDDALVGPYIVTEGNSNNLSWALAKIYGEALVTNGFNGCEFLVDSSLIDSWKRPVNVFWRTNMPENASAELLNSTDMDVVIWSSGKDGVNDFGNGDDIFFRLNFWLSKDREK